jgi:hypothetical protein
MHFLKLWSSQSQHSLYQAPKNAPELVLHTASCMEVANSLRFMKWNSPKALVLCLVMRAHRRLQDPKSRPAGHQQPFLSGPTCTCKAAPELSSSPFQVPVVAMRLKCGPIFIFILSTGISAATQQRGSPPWKVLLIEPPAGTKYNLLA